MIEGEGEDEHRHRCLVRAVLKMRALDRDAAHRFLYGGVDSSGRRNPGWNRRNPNSRLEVDVRIEWSLGNRGEKGDWRQDKKK